MMIGLGGSGQLIVTHLKRLFMDTYGMVPPSVRLLCLDTDVAPVKLRSSISDREYRLDQDEFLHLKVTDPVEYIRNDPTVAKWYAQQRVPVGSLIAGAGGVRQNGRLALFFHINEFMHRIDALSSALLDVNLSGQMEHAREKGAATDFRLSDRPFEVYVCGSLAGGTGSGTFLDVGIILRDKLPNALVHGFFLLDWVYRNKPFTHRIAGNVYAALAELDSLQSVMLQDARQVPYRMQYGARQVEVRTPPYTLFHLIDGRNEYGQNVDDPDELCDIVANAIFLSVGSMGHQIASVVDNLLAHVNASNPALWHGRYARYSSLGVSSIYYPAREFHRLHALQNALRLCREAQADVGGEAGRPVDRDAIEQTLKDLDLRNRDALRAGLCPTSGVTTLSYQPFHVSETAFPSMLRSAADAAERQLEAELDRAHADDGERFFADMSAALKQRITDMVGTRTLDAGHLRDWIAGVRAALETQRTTAVDERNRAREETARGREAVAELMGAAQVAPHRPIFGALTGNPRQHAVDSWKKGIDRLLATIRDARALEYEVAFYDRVDALLKDAAPKVVPKTSDVLDALKQAETELTSALGAERENFKQLKSKPTHMLVANGNIVMIPSDGTLVAKASSGPTSTSSGIDLFALPLSGFKEAAAVHVGSDYLRYRKQGELASVFLSHTMKRLEPLSRVTVAQALDGLDDREYVKARFDDLFRKASALWNFRAASLSALQKPHYAKIVNIGVDDSEAADERYHEVIADAKAKHEIGAYSLTTTGDPYRIWLLNYAAALPVTALGDLKERKRAYEEVLTPPYHADCLFEMNVPDLCPDDDDAESLRLLGMAIVSGIDVVKDEKITRGHRFTFDAPEVREMNFGDPVVWLRFRDMYAAVRQDPALRTTLRDVLRRRVAGLAATDRDQLKRSIQSHVEGHLARVARRDFTRLVSARLTYREGQELKAFLDPRGYGMNIDRYVDGK